MSIYTGPIFILQDLGVTLSTTYSTGATTGFPLSNLGDRTHPIRTYRTTQSPVGATTEIIFDTGAAVPKINAIFIDNTNLASWQIEHSSSISSGYSTWAPLITTTVEPLTERCKLFYDTSSLGANLRYLKLVAPPQTPVASPATQAMVGGLTVGITGNVIELPGGGVTSIEYTTTLPVIDVEFQGGGRESTQIGSKFLEIVLPNEQYLRDSQEDDLTDIFNVDTGPIVFYENADDLSKAFLVRHSQYKNKFGYTVGKIINVPLSFTEVI